MASSCHATGVCRARLTSKVSAPAVRKHVRSRMQILFRPKNLGSYPGPTLHLYGVMRQKIGGLRSEDTVIVTDSRCRRYGLSSLVIRSRADVSVHSIV